MPEHHTWFLFLGGILLASAVLRAYLKDMPLSLSLTYFMLGMAIGPNGIGLIRLDIFEHTTLLELLTEFVVVVSLFTAGLKLHLKTTGRHWPKPISLAVVGVAVSVALIAVLGNTFLGMTWGAAILLGAILAPTDPVLASDVQVEEVADCDRLRFTLTGEGRLNDGTAFPFVMLGLGLLGLHELGDFGWKWVATDVIWATAAGLGIGFLLGYLVGKLVVYVHKMRKMKIEADEFLALGLIALSYGIAIELKAYGFLAVFAAGFALRNFEEKVSTKAPDRVLGFNEQIERLSEIVVVLLFGTLFSIGYFTFPNILIALALIFVIRPISAFASMLFNKTMTPIQLKYIAWFGVRGVGSLYYFFYAMNKDLDRDLAQSFMGILYTTIFASLVLHGVSVTPLMKRYRKKTGKIKKEAPQPS